VIDLVSAGLRFPHGNSLASLPESICQPSRVGEAPGEVCDTNLRGGKDDASFALNERDAMTSAEGVVDDRLRWQMRTFGNVRE
jgi:hypothetical protein